MPTDRKSRFSIDGKHWVILFCLIGLLIFALSYLFIYIPYNEKYLNERRFNAMRRIVTNIDVKQNNTLQLLESLAKAFDNDSINRESLNQYLKNGFSAPLPLVIDHVTISAKPADEKVSLLRGKSRIQTEAAQSNGNIQFTSHLTGEDSVVSIGLNYTIEEFFKPLLQGAGFDEFVVVLNKGIIYESFPSGLSASNFDSLVAINKYLTGANSRKLSLAGIQYQAFIQPYSLGNTKTGSFIIGLVHYEKYEAERIQLPAKKVIVIITLGLLILILLPWIKLFNLGTKDRLTIWDGAASFVVAMLLVSVIFLGFSSLAVRYQSSSPKEGLMYIADQVEARNAAYIRKMKRKLDLFDQMVAHDRVLHTNLIKIDDPFQIQRGTQYTYRRKEAGPLTEMQRDSILTLTRSDPVFQIFWLDSATGKELFNWSTDAYNAPSADLSKRSYFKAQKSAQGSYSADQVISWTTGLFRTIIAKKSGFRSADTAMVACISFPLIPVHKTVLPQGYSFAIVNINGEVLYHSSEIHNLNENFPEETSDAYEIKSALRSHAAHLMETRYKGVDSRLYLKPVSFDGFPYWVIVTCDKTLESTRDTSVFSFTLVMLLAFFVLVFVQMLAVVVISTRKSKLNFLRHETDWIWPRPSFFRVYQYASSYHIQILILLVATWFFAGFVSYIFTLLLAVCIVSSLINFLYIVHYRAEKRISVIRYKKRNILVLAAIQVILNLFSFWQLWDDKIQIAVVLLFQMFAMLLAGWVVSLFSKIKKSSAAASKSNMDIKQAAFIKSYARMAITRLLITSGLPVLFFYQYSYNHEQAMLSHFYQLAFARQVFDAQPREKNSGAPQKPNYYCDNYWIKDSIPPTKKEKAIPLKKSDSLANELLNSFRVYQSNNGLQAGPLAHFIAHDSSYTLFPLPGNQLHDTTYGTQVHFRPEQSFSLSSANIRFQYPFPLTVAAILYWILFGGAVLVLYMVIKKVIRRIFALDVPGEVFSDALAKKIINFGSGSKLTFLTGLPGSQKMKFVRDNTPKEGRYEIDLIQKIPKNNQWKPAVTIVFNHFEYVLMDKPSFSGFLELLEKMLVSEDKPAIIIVSTLYADRAASLVAKLYNDESATPKERFRLILGHFYTIILPIQAVPPHEVTLDAWEQKNKIQWMGKEFNVSPFFERLRLPLKDAYFARWEPEKVKYAKHKWVKWVQVRLNLVRGWFNDAFSSGNENAILSLQNIGGNFYHHIWQSLSPEERYLVYDLAEEGLVNQSNKYHLAMLIQKGLIKRKEPFGQLALMNDSFKDFVLLSVDKKEALQIRNELKSTGSWSELKTPIMLVVIGILLILFASQQEAFSTIIGYLTAIAALIPTLNAIFSLVKPAAPAKNPG